MTRGAFAVRHRWVRRDRLDLALHRIAMTAPTQHRFRLLQQRLLLRGMRIVAVGAGRLVDHGPVNPRLGQRFIDHVDVAATAQISAGLLQLDDTRRGWLDVTLPAHLAGDRLMHAGPQRSAATRAVRIMAGDAIRFGHVVAHVRFGERRISGLVAGAAQRGDRRLQE